MVAPADFTIRFHPAAREELRAATSWYTQRDPAVATRFGDAVDHALNQIAAAPTRWPVHVLGTRRYVMKGFPYSVVFRLIGGLVQVVAVAHARRRPQYWSRRLVD